MGVQSQLNHFKEKLLEKKNRSRLMVSWKIQIFSKLGDIVL